ncbi:hypothetical protein CSOJ01_05518 [Colletotrichum sojae]|uniref:Uncharacterized protein n=1 Tax=Colletotrichum sojae TaxID=2175907 RepID=A0A8H6MXF2_9PEZI|nr:hypothetical protein CSOJ01_05518 [Colletotrichum sojae]
MSPPRQRVYRCAATTIADLGSGSDYDVRLVPVGTEADVRLRLCSRGRVKDCAAYYATDMVEGSRRQSRDYEDDTQHRNATQRSIFRCEQEEPVVCVLWYRAVASFRVRHDAPRGDNTMANKTRGVVWQYGRGGGVRGVHTPMSVRMTAPLRLGDAKMRPTVTGQQERQEHPPPPQH